jgi:hypothetical protein
MKYKLLTVFALSALGAGTVVRSTPAAAAATFLSYPASMCAVSNIDFNWAGAASFNLEGQAYNGNGASGFTKLFCPVVSTPGQGVGASISFWSNGLNSGDAFEGSSSVSFELCSMSAGGGGGTCDQPQRWTGGSGVYSLDTSDLLIGLTGDYFFLDVSLGPAASTSSEASKNVLFGYTVASGF